MAALMDGGFDACGTVLGSGGWMKAAPSFKLSETPDAGWIPRALGPGAQDAAGRFTNEVAPPR